MGARRFGPRRDTSSRPSASITCNDQWPNDGHPEWARGGERGRGNVRESVFRRQQQESRGVRKGTGISLDGSRFSESRMGTAAVVDGVLVEGPSV